MVIIYTTFPDSKQGAALAIVVASRYGAARRWSARGGTHGLSDQGRTVRLAFPSPNIVARWPKRVAVGGGRGYKGSASVGFVIRSSRSASEADLALRPRGGLDPEAACISVHDFGLGGALRRRLGRQRY